MSIQNVKERIMFDNNQTSDTQEKRLINRVICYLYLNQDISHQYFDFKGHKASAIHFSLIHDFL